MVNLQPTHLSDIVNVSQIGELKDQNAFKAPTVSNSQHKPC